MVRLRRLSQIVFFALFLVLLLRTEFRGSLRATAGDIRLPYPVRWFLELDPLAAISNALSTHALYRGLLWSLIIIVPTFLLGRFFCGWICPLGSLNHFFGNFRSESKLGAVRLEKNRYQRWQTLKYYLLIALLVAAVFGAEMVGIFDPISLTVRSLALSVLPGLNYAANAFIRAAAHSQVGVVHFAGDVFALLVKDQLLSFKQPYFRQGFFIGLIFIIILALNLRITRFWCRALCPLGALLGVLARWSVLGLEKDPSKCDECNRCLLHCQGGDDPLPGAKWRKSECHLCFNCAAACPQDSLAFKFFPRSLWIKQTDGAPSETRWQSATATTMDGPDLTRRRVLTGAAAGVALVPLLRSTSGFVVERHERLIRPPGALDESDFLARCIRCGECMKVCPNNSLHPTLTEAGWEGLWSPVLVPRIGYCEPSCTLCGQVCPTGAIWEITAAEKAWVAGNGNSDKPVRIGTAFYDRGRCLPWAMAIECIVCQEWCPTSPKAIYLIPAEVKDAAGNLKQVKQPYLNPERCVGCGACEYACPVQDRPAVYVTSVGESRSKTNQILLQRRGKTRT